MVHNIGSIQWQRIVPTIINLTIYSSWIVKNRAGVITFSYNLCWLLQNTVSNFITLDTHYSKGNNQ